jgi:hypothetical protein
MTGRSAHMDAAQVALGQRGLRPATRLACVLAGLLCAVGVLSGATLHASGITHHRAAHIAAISTLADGHGTGVRTEQHAVATFADPVRQGLRFGLATSSRATSVAVAPVDSVRTRGPPALA